MFNPCVLIPVYNHEHAIGAVVEAVQAHAVHCILVDDGCSPACAQVLDAIAVAKPEHVTLLRHERNRGKGAAVLTGFAHASRSGFTHLLQVDADGQHCLADVPRFLALAREHPDTVIAGCPIFDESVPKVRLYGRYFTHVSVWIVTLSFAIRDTMCGFRAYPIPAVMRLIGRQRIGQRMNFDTDLLVRLYWQGVDVINLPTRVNYPTDGVSHFRLWRDNVLITRMLVTLLFGMLPRMPALLMRTWRKR